MRFSAPVQTGPGAHPASCKMGTGSFLGVKRPGRGTDHPLPSSAEIKEREELNLNSPSGPSWPVLGWNSHFTAAKFQDIYILVLLQFVCFYVSHDGTALPDLGIIVSPVTTKLSRLSQDNELKITFRVIRRSQHRSPDVPVERTLLQRHIVARSYLLEITDTCGNVEHFHRAKLLHLWR